MGCVGTTELADGGVTNDKLVNSAINLNTGATNTAVSLGDILTITGGSGIDVTLVDSEFTIALGGTISITNIDVTSFAINSVNVTSTAAELNILDGVTASSSELNYLDITAAGSTEASKAWVSDANNDITHFGDLAIDGGNISVTGSANVGNITIADNLSSFASTNLKIKDSLIELNSDASAIGGTRDIGIFGRLDPQNGGNTNVVGLFYDGSDSMWKATYGATPGTSNWINSITSYKPVMAQNFIPTGVSVKTANYTTTNSDDTIIVTAQTVTITLHSVSTVDGQRITVINDVGGIHTCTVAGVNGGDVTLAHEGSITVVRANSKWYVVSKYTA